MNKNSIPNIWTAQEKVTHLYKILALGLGIFSFAIMVALIAERFQNPIVVVRSENSQEFYPTERQRASLEKADIEIFTKRFLVSLYTWKEFNAANTARDIAPFAESGLVTKVTEGQNQKYAKELKGKRLAQAITFVRVDVMETQVVAYFDRVLKIEGIPLIIPTEVTLSMVQGDPTRLNPMGIYVSGITETDGAK